MEEKKNGSPASTATGTAQSSSLATTNNNTAYVISQVSNYSKAEEAAVAMVVEKANQNGGLHTYPLSLLANEINDTMRDIVDSVNIPAKNGGRELGWKKPTMISGVQAAQLVFEYERIRMVCTEETVGDANAEGVIAMYVNTGENAGVYREIGIGQIDEWCSEIGGLVKTDWKNEFTRKLHDLASRDANRVKECNDSNLIFMANGIFDYETKMLLPFDPDIVALRKSATALPNAEPPVPVHTKPDGTKIDFWEWIDSLVPYNGGRDLLVKLAGACLRDRHNWRVMVTMFNKTGHNGKTTFMELLKALVGYTGVMTSSLAELAGNLDGGRFGVANIVGKALVTCEDSNSGAYIKDNSRLKSIISHDSISVERKNKTAFDYTPHALIVCAANDIAKTKDKGQAWLDRNIYVPFTGQFIGDKEDKTIRSEWVVSDEVCEYMAYQALVKWDKYYSLPEPEEAIALKDEWVRDNDPIVDFYEEEIRYFNADFIPSLFAWDMYLEWLRDSRPSTSPCSQKAFTSHFIEIASSGDEWSYPKSGKDGVKLSGARWCPSIVDQNENGQKYKDRLRGIVRTKVWMYCTEHNTTPADLGAAYEGVRRQLGVVYDENDTDA